VPSGSQPGHYLHNILLPQELQLFLESKILVRKTAANGRMPTGRQDAEDSASYKEPPMDNEATLLS
jgi:hypothetical protein